MPNEATEDWWKHSGMLECVPASIFKISCVLQTCALRRHLAPLPFEDLQASLLSLDLVPGRRTGVSRTYARIQSSSQRA